MRHLLHFNSHNLIGFDSNEYMKWFSSETHKERPQVLNAQSSIKFWRNNSDYQRQKLLLSSSYNTATWSVNETITKYTITTIKVIALLFSFQLCVPLHAFCDNLLIHVSMLPSGKLEPSFDINLYNYIQVVVETSQMISNYLQ